MSEELNKITGERLRQCIHDANMTQKEVALDANYTEQHISKLVKGKSRLTTDTAKNLASILKVRMEYLLCEDNYKTEIDKISSELRDIKGISQNICNIMECKGFILIEDDYIRKSGAFKTISLFYPDEICNKTDKELRNYIDDKLSTAYEQRMLALKHPHGRVIRLTEEKFLDLLNDIEKYIDYKLHLEFDNINNFLYPIDMKPNKIENKL